MPQAKPTPSSSKPRLLKGGNPQVAKADGDAPVQAYIDALAGWKQTVVRQLDGLITRTVPGTTKAVRWNSPMYGMPGQGWFVSIHVFTHCVKITFFKGIALQPVPPGGAAKEARWLDIAETGLAPHEVQLADWLQQAASIPGWGKT